MVNPVRMKAGRFLKKSSAGSRQHQGRSVSLGRRTLMHSILLTVGEVHQNLDNEKEGESRPSLLVRLSNLSEERGGINQLSTF